MKEIIDLLQDMSWEKSDELIKIAKGKYEYPSNFKIFIKKIKAKFNKNK